MTTKLSPIEVERGLSGISYPTEKQDLINFAKSKNADKSMISALNSLPNRQYSNSADIVAALGGDTAMNDTEDTR